MTPTASSGTTITFRCDEEFKAAVGAAAAAEGRDMTDFIVQAARQRIDAVCPRCGRVDRPTAGAGLSEAFTSFLERIHRERDMMPVCVTAVLGAKSVAYRARIKLTEASQGQLLMQLDFKQGSHPHTAEFSIPRGIITGWQQDNGEHLERLTRLGYTNGNDSVIRAFLRGRPEVVTVRAVSDHICEHPGVTDDALVEYFRQLGARSARAILHQAGIIRGDPRQGWGSKYPDADAALQIARERRIDIDADVG
jgi:uncharacterized protein (DUF1778 family)